MKKRILGYVLLLFCVLSVSVAQENETTQKMGLEVPEIYVVKEGDTLWDISGNFFGDPFEWPDVWKKNAFIIDPHWIYPGQKLTLIPEKKLIIPVQPAPPPPLPEPVIITSAPREPKPVAAVVEPPVKMSRDDSNIIHKLSSPRPVYSAQSYMRAGFITLRSELPKKKVIEIEDRIANATKYDIVTIDAGTKEGVRAGDLFAVLAVGEGVKHPDTGKNLGVVVSFIGILRVESAGENQSRCQVTENFDPIEEQNLVMPYRPSSGPMFDAWIRPEVAIKGTILAVNEPMFSIHTNDILYIDQGSKGGVQPGDRFIIYSRSDDTGHREILGEVEAIKVMPRETAVIVVSLKDENVDIGDRVELSARCRLVN
ncbi:LysM peptidoglycan-binding domain-containing protein [Candidatus Latescibacterota bacterium]